MHLIAKWLCHLTLFCFTEKSDLVPLIRVLYLKFRVSHFLFRDRVRKMLDKNPNNNFNVSCEITIKFA
jgi:hypothetical protein